MQTSDIKIVIIDDNFPADDPLVILLRKKYGKTNVLVIKKSSEGLRYILDNLSGKMIVLLDLDLGAGEPHGVEVFERIREETSLVYVIIMTAKQLTTIPSVDLLKFINNDALAIVNNTDDIKDVLEIVDKAAHKLSVRLDCVLEEWILNRSNKDLNKPYMSTKDGRTYTLNDIVGEIRHATPLGETLEKGILQVSIDLLTNGNKKIND